MRTLDPKWIVAGEFDVSKDGSPTRTQQIRDALSEMCGHELRLKKTESYGHASGYYLREHDVGERHAQYVMSIDKDYGALSLGISVEKGEEGRDAGKGRAMRRAEWDWPRLVSLTPERLNKHVADIANLVKRPVANWISAHFDDGETEHDREERAYTIAGTDVFCRGRRSSLREVVARAEALVGRCLVFCDYGIDEVAKMQPTDAASILFAFETLKQFLNGSE